MQKLRIGIIGCGTISPIHAEAIAKCEHAELASVFSRNEEKANTLAKKFNVPAFTDWQQFISDKNLDAVSICTPSGTHLDYVKLAAQACKHVLIEKPIEVTVERGRELINACNNNGVKLAVIYQNRYNPDTFEMKRRIDAGDIGEIFMADAYIKWFRDQAYYDSADWRGTLALDGGGVLINQAIHTIDLLQWLAGDVESIFGQTGTLTHSGIEGEDNAVATLRFKSGAIGVLQGSTSVIPATSARIEIHGTKGTAILDGQSVTFKGDNFEPRPETEAAEGAGASSPMAGMSSSLHQHQFEEIVDAILNDRTPPVSGEDSLKSLAIVRGVYESAKLGTVVKL